MATVFEKIIAAALATKVAAMREQCKSKEMGKAKDGTPVLGFTPQQRLQLRVADTCEELAKDLSNPER